MKLLLVDGTNMTMRYAHAMLGDPSVEHPAADGIRMLVAVERAILECVQATGADRCVIALDSPEKTWRHERFPAYKAHRPPGLTGLWSAKAGNFLADQGWLCVAVPGFEGDDIIATLAARAVSAGHCAALLSSDSDLLQLHDESVECWQFGKKPEPKLVRRREDWIQEKYGLDNHEKLRYYKALVGEPGDNLPGVRGIGPVKACAMLKGRGHELMGALADGMQAEFDLMLELVTLRKDAPIEPINPSACRVPGC